MTDPVTSIGHCPTCDSGASGEMRVNRETRERSYRYICCMNITPWMKSYNEAAAVWNGLVDWDPTEVLEGDPPWIKP